MTALPTPATDTGNPAWLTAPAQAGVTFELERHGIGLVLWSPADAGDGEVLPMLVAHDGPEYDRLASLTHYIAAGITGNWLPRMRLALLRPRDRNRQYSASTRYSRSLVEGALQTLPARPRIGMGTSLGALAMLHAYCRRPSMFDALFLQSGSFFSPLLDAHERRFRYFWRIAGFVADVQHGGLPDHPIPVVLTCGAAEENIHNNRLMTQALSARGYPVILHEVPGMHDYVAWRDAFDPYLTRLLQQVIRSNS
ncbi:MAG TPA: alpha/beta hydrolase-fold protein [Streptosporangiaceae bacterium]